MKIESLFLLVLSLSYTVAIVCSRRVSGAQAAGKDNLPTGPVHYLMDFSMLTFLSYGWGCYTVYTNISKSPNGINLNQLSKIS